MVLTATQIDTITLLVKVLAFFSVIITSVTLYVYFRKPNTDPFTTTLIVNLIICNFLNCASFLLPTGNVTCCTVQSLFVTVFAMGIYGWGLCCSVSVWLNLRHKVFVGNFQIFIKVCFYCFSSLIPLAVSVLFFTNKRSF